ncbi:hypothetical protein E2P81_ATG09895 [Venturia nashicola]|uniref:C2H2-type domain-containing protein n=1 Tax=Venturia nashicola TaxID=86259 RepID=A0A4Z1NWW7_9PEZI|nr:hypothetical protein E6O75_ATG10111 [Venturia nashicola]TLD15047.1 hypothetical protein E2P81_ATG09895 [Venturia nashicola]
MPATPTSKPKRFACTYDGCGKRFTRSDHLQRHYLNHKGGDNTCPRCNLHFKRPDLLERHLVRHQEKDEEAGGEGLGDLQTRKKLWRDADGRIVTKRPTQNANQQHARKKQPEVTEESLQGQDNYFNQNVYQDLSTVLLSPPGTLLSIDSSDQFSQLSPGHPLPEQNQVAQDGMFDFLSNSTWGDLPDGPLDMQSDAPMDDIFRPDTGNSFNMPFTTMNNYNWLFDAPADASMETGKSCGSDMLSNSIKMPIDLNEVNDHIVASNFAPPNNLDDFEIARSNDTMVWDDLAHETTACQPQKIPGGQVPKRPAHGRDNQVSWSSNNAASTRRQPLCSEPHLDTPISIKHSSTSASRNPTREPEVAAQQTNYRRENVSRTHLSTPIGPPYSTPDTPIMDNDSRGRILHLLTAARPLMPSNIDVGADNPLLSLVNMQSCLDLFFSRFNVVYPLLHKPTFEPAKTEAFLLLAVLLLGATYSDKEMHMLAVCIHDTLRAQIFQHPEFTAQPELWILQTMLLVECFGKSRAGQKQHDMSHLFHGLLINLIRRSDCQTVRQPELDDGNQDIVLFSQSLCMSSFELRTSLPCNEAAWEASSAEEWRKHVRSESQISYLTVLRAYVNPDSGAMIPNINSLSRLLLLHGLMSIQWDMKRRDQASLGYGPNQVKWEERLSRCYDAWKADFDNHSMNMMLSLSNNPSRRAEFTRFSTSTMAIYHAAYITLHVEILDLQIYAGARHIIGRPVFLEDFNRSRRVLKEWAKPSGDGRAAKAVWHAASLLKDGIMKLENWDVDSAFHYPWCLYLASLTCWAFHFANVLDTTANAVECNYQQANVVSTPNVGDGEGDLRESKAEMIALVSHLATAMPCVLWTMLDKRTTSAATLKSPPQPLRKSLKGGQRHRDAENKARAVESRARATNESVGEKICAAVAAAEEKARIAAEKADAAEQERQALGHVRERLLNSKIFRIYAICIEIEFTNTTLEVKVTADGFERWKRMR